MFLNIFDSIRNFFKNMIENIDFSSIVSLLFGVVLGILICLVVFLVLYSSSINKNDKRKIKTWVWNECLCNTITSKDRRIFKNW